MAEPTEGIVASVMTVERTASALMTTPGVVRTLISDGKLAATTCAHCGGETVRAEAVNAMFRQNVRRRNGFSR